MVAENDGAAITVGFADHKTDTKKYVLLERSLVCDEQDKALGFDKVHIEVEDQIHSTYGGVDSIRISGKLIKIELTPKGKDSIKIADDLTISLKCGDSVIGPAVEQLRNLAHGEFLIVDE